MDQGSGLIHREPRCVLALAPQRLDRPAEWALPLRISLVETSTDRIRTVAPGERTVPLGGLAHTLVDVIQLAYSIACQVKENQSVEVSCPNRIAGCVADIAGETHTETRELKWE